MTPETLALIRRMHDNEATDALIYAALARRTTGDNRALLERMAADEQRHCAVWSAHTGEQPRVRRLRVRLYNLLGALFGPTFAVNLLEAGEGDAQRNYALLAEEVPEARRLLEDEVRHEAELASMIIEDRLRYIGSMVLGLNDALVELTGALAGFTLALGDTRTAGLAGLITGVAATLSMAASEYLSKKADPGEKHPLKASVYTGIAYLITVALLLTPFFVFTAPPAALAGSLTAATLIILGFTFFVSVVQREPFAPAFARMLAISFGVALVSFLIGWGAQAWLGVQM